MAYISYPLDFRTLVSNVNLNQLQTTIPTVNNMTYFGEEEKIIAPMTSLMTAQKNGSMVKFIFLEISKLPPSLQNNINQKLYIFLIFKMIPDSRGASCTRSIFSCDRPGFRRPVLNLRNTSGLTLFGMKFTPTTPFSEKCKISTLGTFSNFVKIRPYHPFLHALACM